MLRDKRLRGAAAAVAALVAVFAASGCGGGRGVTIAGDQFGCVYTSAERGHEFVRAIDPGQNVSIGSTDELVLIPTGDQIYNMTTTENHTRFAPERVLAFTKAQTAVWVEGVLKFRFNTANGKACDWYTKYGLQSSSYGDLGFAVHTGIGPKRTGW